MSLISETRIEEVDGFHVGVVVFGERMECLSSAVLNGGDSLAEALFIMQVPRDYSERDPRAHAASVRDRLGLPEDTVGMMTAAEVARVFNVAEGECDGVRVSAVATAGLSNHVVAGETLDNYPERRLVSDRRAAALAGTINIAVISPVPLTTEGKVNMMIPLVEAKSAAMADRGYRETGTTSDAMAVLCPVGGGRVGYTGTGSSIGIAAARAVRSAVGHALEVRGEHPVLEEPYRLLGDLGYDIGRLASMSGTGLSVGDFKPRLDRILEDPEVRSLLDLAMFCADRADSMAEDGNGWDRKHILRIAGNVTGVDVDPGIGTIEAVLTAICRYAGERFVGRGS